LHISVAELGVILTSTIVGGELSLAPGVALAQKMGQGEAGAITAVFFGDGAACEGIFHEAVNLAVTWQLPLLFVCENNQWQAYVARRETMPADPAATAVLGGGRIAATSSRTTRRTSIRPSWRVGSRSTRSRALPSACSTRRSSEAVSCRTCASAPAQPSPPP